MEGTRSTVSGAVIPRLQMRVFDLTDADGMKGFLQDDSVLVRVPGSGREVRYRSGKKTGITVTRLGTSRAVALGAYAYALSELDATN